MDEHKPNENIEVTLDDIREVHVFNTKEFQELKTRIAKLETRVNELELKQPIEKDVDWVA